MRGPAPAPPRFIALGFPERVMMRCVRVLVQKKSDAVGITLSANPCTGARVAPQRCPVFRYSQKQFHDTTTARMCQAANWPPIMTLTGRELRPCWPGITAICNDGQPNYEERLKASFNAGNPLIPSLKEYCDETPAPETYRFSFTEGSPDCFGHPKLFSHLLLERIMEELGEDVTYKFAFPDTFLGGDDQTNQQGF